MSSTEAIVYSTLDITERTVLPRSDDESLWDKVQPTAAVECPEALLLVWPIFGPITDIAVLDSTAASGEALKNRQSFVIENPDGSKTFHPVALLPATYPLLSRIVASVGIFDEFLAVSERMTELHEFDWDNIEEAQRAGVTKFYCCDEECKSQLPSTDTKFWVSSLWGTNVLRQGGIGSGEQSKWNPETGEGCPQTEEEWEELLEMARKKQRDLRARGDGGHKPGMVEVDKVIHIRTLGLITSKMESWWYQYAYTYVSAFVSIRTKKEMPLGKLIFKS